MRVLLALSGLALLAGQAQKTPQPVQVWEKSLAPGLVYRMEVDPNIPRTLHAVRFSPKCPSLRWMTELAGRTINEEGTTKGRLTPTDMAAQTGALVAVNGDFFSYDHGAPIGQMVRNGELITSAIRPRAVFAWGPKDLAMGMASWKGSVSLEDGEDIDLENLNQPVGANSLVLYTPAVGTALISRDHVAVTMSMPNAVVGPTTEIGATVRSASSDETKIDVGPGQAVLVATGSNISRLARLRRGDRVMIHLKTGGFEWEKFDNEIGGGPFLVRDGKASVDAADEGFRGDFVTRNPRTSIGKTADGDVWIVTVDGRQGCSAGATLDEMADVMLHLGCQDAINLDGGGSTALNLLGLTVGRPSDGFERQVSSGILIYGPKAPPTPGELKMKLPAKIGVAGTGTATITLDGKPVANADILWSSRGTAWIDQGGTIHGLHAGKARILARVYGKPLEASIVVIGNAVADPKKIPPADQEK